MDQPVCRGVYRLVVAVCLVLLVPMIAAAQVTWNSDLSTGSWHDSSKWTPALPTASDNVVIDRLTSSVTVTHSAGNTTVNGLTLRENLDVTGGAVTVSNGLTIGDNFRVKATGGGSFSAGGNISFNGAALYAGIGSSISLPTATSYTTNSGPPFLSLSHIHADGGSINLSGLTTFLGTGSALARADATASNGGTVNFSGLGNLYGGIIQLTTNGTSSQINASSIGTIQSSYSIHLASKLEAINGGTLSMGGITNLDRVDLVSDGTGTMATSQITTFTRGTAQITGGTPNFSGMETIDGASFVVSGGAVVSVPNAFGWADPTPDTFAARSFSSNGTGSTLDLSTLVSVAGATTTGNSPLAIQALAGGNTTLSGLPQITQGIVRVDASGSGSVVDLSNLTRLSATYQFVGSRSHLKATAGGTILTGKLKRLDQVDMYIDGTGTMATAQIQEFKNGTAFVSGATTQPNFSGMTNIDGASLQVSGGAKVTVPAISYIDLAATTFPTRRFQATGSGSEIDASAITTFRTSDQSFAETHVEAYQGGKVDLTGVAAPYPGSGTIKFTANGTASGTPSEVDISGLTTFKMTPQFARRSGIAAVNGGKINMPNLTALEYVDLQNDGTGQMQIAQIQEFARGNVTMTGGSHEFTNLTNIDGASFVATGGAVIDAPIVNHYDDTASGAFSDRLIRASGNGSRIDLSNLTDLDTTPAAFTVLKIEALAGGFVDLSGLATFDTGAVQILADGTNGSGTRSVVDLSSLTTFNPLVVFGETSGITVTNGGELRLGFVPLRGLNLKVSSGGRIVASDYQLTNGTILSGNGTFTGSVSNRSVVSPGNSPDTLVIDGAYSQTGNGTLLIELQGTSGGQYDVLQISGAASLAGTLDIDLLGGFTPTLGQSFQFLTADGGVTGQFDTLSLPSLSGGNFWQVDYGTTSVAITAVPEPSTVALFVAAGMLAVASRYRRRHH